MLRYVLSKRAILSSRWLLFFYVTCVYRAPSSTSTFYHELFLSIFYKTVSSLYSSTLPHTHTNTHAYMYIQILHVYAIITLYYSQPRAAGTQTSCSLSLRWRPGSPAPRRSGRPGLPGSPTGACEFQFVCTYAFVFNYLCVYVSFTCTCSVHAFTCISVCIRVCVNAISVYIFVRVCVGVWEWWQRSTGSILSYKRLRESYLW